jgi:hypothetical protein
VDLELPVYLSVCAYMSVPVCLCVCVVALDNTANSYSACDDPSFYTMRYKVIIFIVCDNFEFSGCVPCFMVTGPYVTCPCAASSEVARPGALNWCVVHQDIKQFTVSSSRSVNLPC